MVPGQAWSRFLGEHSDGRKHRVEVVHGLAHAHEDHVPRGSGGRGFGPGHRVLKHDLSCRELPREAESGGRAEAAVLGAAGLARDADRGAALGRNEHGLHRGGAEGEGELGRAIGR